MSALDYRKYKGAAEDALKIGGDVERAQAFATLALAEAISDSVSDVASMLEKLANPLITVEQA